MKLHCIPVLLLLLNYTSGSRNVAILCRPGIHEQHYHIMIALQGTRENMVDKDVYYIQMRYKGNQWKDCGNCSLSKQLGTQKRMNCYMPRNQYLHSRIIQLVHEKHENEDKIVQEKFQAFITSYHCIPHKKQNNLKLNISHKDSNNVIVSWKNQEHHHPKVQNKVYVYVNNVALRNINCRCPQQNNCSLQASPVQNCSISISSMRQCHTYKVCIKMKTTKYGRKSSCIKIKMLCTQRKENGNTNNKIKHGTFSVFVLIIAVLTILIISILLAEHLLK